ncbi:hypothetical protein GFV12_02990 [Desulfurobacterium thermolithotrophum]|uniref:hypothetical protein n=1 Tax=Desulfurobacterium thermolithotrophum TaxID=64160 RepID=UPI0013D89E89|nr:hypothetical protein [Desulfurobacterium thermolithotrophum]
MERFETLLEAIEKVCKVNPRNTTVCGREPIGEKIYYLVFAHTTGMFALIEETKEGFLVDSLVTPLGIIDKLLEE